MQNCNSKFKTNLNLRCYNFSLNIIALTNKLENKRSNWIITDQIIKSATSVGANLVEAKASSSRLEFKKFNEISLKSANETKYWLCLLRDTDKIDSTEIKKLLNEITEISNMLASGILKLKNKKF